MTRKRFIKLLMSHGESRNEATKIALYYNHNHYSYKSAYSKYLLKHTSDVFNKLGMSVAEASMAMVEFSKALSKLTTVSDI